MRSLQLLGIIIAFFGLFDRWGKGVNNPDIFSISFFPNPTYYGHSILIPLILVVLLLILFIILPIIAFKGDSSRNPNLFGIWLSIILIVAVALHTFFAYFPGCIFYCDTGPGPTIGPLLMIAGMSLFGFSSYKKLSKIKKSG